MSTNHLNGFPHGTNVFDDLLEACMSTATSLRVSGNRPLGVLDVIMLGRNIDCLLDALAAVTRTAPRAGDAFDLTGGDSQINPDRAVWPVQAWCDDEMLDDLEHRGFFDQFSSAERSRARAALESIDQAEFAVHLIERAALTPVGLFDVVATAVQIAITGPCGTAPRSLRGR